MKLTILFLFITICIYCSQSNLMENNQKSHHQFKINQKNRIQHLLKQIQIDPTRILLEGWLQISSPSFNDQNRFPIIKQQVSNGSQYNNQRLRNFRKNSQFKPGNSVTPYEDAFYFRVTSTNIYYTDTRYSTVILGAVAIKNILSFQQDNNCLEIQDREQDQWTMCAVEYQKPIERWICAIQKSMGQPCQISRQKQVIEKQVIVKQPVIIIPLPSPDCSRDWNYNDHGNKWMCRCKEGREQSPINLLSNPTCLKKIKLNAFFDYPKVKKTDLSLKYDINMLRIKPKNEDINFGQISDIDGNIYQASEIQFHTPSEHQIDGKRYDLEVQVIHRAIKGQFRNKAVLSILYQKKPGESNSFFSKLDIVNLPNPLSKQSENALPEEFSVQQLLFNDENVQDASPGLSFNYYKYHGSFTSPPCEENVIWFVAADIVPLSNTVIDFIQESLKTPKISKGNKELNQNMQQDNSDGNYREIQQQNERQVYYYQKEQSSIPYQETQKGQQEVGHYEKKITNVTEYIYVDSKLPSGLPNSFVVGQNEALGLNQNQNHNGINNRKINS